MNYDEARQTQNELQRFSKEPIEGWRWTTMQQVHPFGPGIKLIHS